MVGFLTCCECGGQVAIKEPRGLRSAVVSFCDRHRHWRLTRVVAQFGIDPPAEKSIDELRDMLLEARSVA
jgi:hypothetical protein